MTYGKYKLITLLKFYKQPLFLFLIYFIFLPGLHPFIIYLKGKKFLKNNNQLIL